MTTNQTIQDVVQFVGSVLIFMGLVRIPKIDVLITTYPIITIIVGVVLFMYAKRMVAHA